MSDTRVELTDWLSTLQSAQPLAQKLLSQPPASQQKQGYFHTLREICQQPISWRNTADLVVADSHRLKDSLDGIQNIVLTGSGSSEYAGECVRLALQNQLGISTTVIGGGTLVEHGPRAVPPMRPALMISIARSGDSPESFAALSLFLESDPEVRHLVLTCNAQGKLATSASDRVTVLTLDDSTNDRSLVMTSSFTNLVLAARALGYLDQPESYREVCSTLSDIASRILLADFGRIAAIAESPFRRAVFLADSTRFGAAREGALKMLEASAGRVATMSETYLGFRHGPMSFAHNDALIVCFLSSDPSLRGFECDLLRELEQKELGMAKLVVGEQIPADVLREGDVSVECPGLMQVGDQNAPVIDVLVSQLLAFFRSQYEGLHPDAPSDGVINRVVQKFQMHFPGTSQ
jgi:tagatose-6-phosphate ketose/aldose isomerase